MNLLAFLCAVALSIPPVDSAVSTRGTAEVPLDNVVVPMDVVTVPVATEYTLDGGWQLSWDDQVGQELSGEVKTCEIRLRHVGSKVTGRFSGRVAGTMRNAILEGELIHQSGGYVFLLQQHEPDYVCTYQICWTESQGITDKVGVWTDTKGRSGNFSVLKLQ
ncbi:hypothetical protein [Aeoliella mucimassa]|uniref:Uncharacterized protein n=1 Tax=Aeoliella mucimassa TaxID=2527972 RepID=A0A518AND5_9BACT|nr:hypothetical protein [Aeoliella mucimassa]QDU56242.1 hypothetical protein Pan181_24500 [Aeoliella mucimassa]